MNPVPVVLYGDRVRIEPLDHRHADDLLAAAADPEIWRFMPIPQPASGGDLLTWIDDAWRRAAAGDQLPFAVVDHATDRAIGSTRFLEIRRSWRTLEIGWTWLSASAQRTPVNTECKYLLLRHAIEELGALRVQFKTDARNERSQRSLERIGAVKEGVLRKQRINWDGFVRDAVYYSIVDEDWPAVKARLEKLLSRSPVP
ncbi:MAG: GNAT family N-acetyltransferase [Gemmatimonadales bacterium]